MKTVTLLIIIAASFNLPVFSQDNEPKNMAKVNLSAFVTKGFGIQYERKVSHRTTLALGYSAIPTSTLPFKSYLNNKINNPNVKIDAFQVGTSVITPELRYYFGSGGAFHGFYLAPYARISGYNVQGPISYTTSTKETRTAVFDGRINMISGGLMMGSNFKLSDKIYLDWWIAGASFGGANGNIHAETPLNPDEQIALKRELDRVDIPFTTIQSEVNSNGATVTSKGNVVGVRGFGINIGYRF